MFWGTTGQIVAQNHSISAKQKGPSTSMAADLNKAEAFINSYKNDSALAILSNLIMQLTEQDILDFFWFKSTTGTGNCISQ
jgi:hypothetical protein